MWASFFFLCRKRTGIYICAKELHFLLDDNKDRCTFNSRIWLEFPLPFRQACNFMRPMYWSWVSHQWHCQQKTLFKKIIQTFKVYLCIALCCLQFSGDGYWRCGQRQWLHFWVSELQSEGLNAVAPLTSLIYSEVSFINNWSYNVGSFSRTRWRVLTLILKETWQEHVSSSLYAMSAHAIYPNDKEYIL